MTSTLKPIRTNDRGTDIALHQVYRDLNEVINSLTDESVGDIKGKKGDTRVVDLKGTPTLSYRSADKWHYLKQALGGWSIFNGGSPTGGQVMVFTETLDYTLPFTDLAETTALVVHLRHVLASLITELKRANILGSKSKV